MNTRIGKGTERGGDWAIRLFLTTMSTLVFFLITHTACFATSVTLQWDANTDSNLAGYRVYYQADSSSQPFEGTGATEGSAPVDVGNTTSATISGLDSSHAYYFAVTAYNSSGEESAYSDVVSVSELVSPITSITYPASNATVSGTVSIAASASDNVGVTKVEFYVNDVLQSTENSSPYVYSWNTTGFSSGNYTLVTKAYDAAGNMGQSGSVVVTVANDTTAPMVSLSAPANGSTLSGVTKITVSASDDTAVSNVELYANGMLLSAANSAPYSYSWNTTAVANGSYTLLAKAYDAAGNVGQSSSISVTVFNDTTAPVVSAFSMPSTSTSLAVAVSSFTASDNVGVTGYLVTESAAAPSASASGWSVSVPTAFTFSGEGTKTAYAWARDAAGNLSSSRSATVTITMSDKPTVSIVSPVSGATVAGTVTISASASDNVGVTKVAFYVNGSLKSTDTAAPYSYSWSTKAIANGSYTIMVKAYDASGNVTTDSIPVTVFNDKTAPVVSITSPANSAKVSDTVTINAAASDNVEVTRLELYVNGVLKDSQAAAACSFNWNTKDVGNGSYTIKAKAYDAAGNVKSTSISVKVLNDTIAPTVSIASPSKNARVRGTVSVKTRAKDNFGVAKVEFYVNGLLKASETTSTPKFSWNTKDTLNGSYTIMAKAYDAAGNVRSTSRLVTVDNL